MLLAWGFHTLVLILAGVMLGINALIFFYDRTNTRVGLILSAIIEFFALVMKGYQTLALMLIGAIVGISALAFIYYDGQHVWSWWFPDQPLGPTVKRWLRYLLQALTVALAYVVARVYINELTGVDPGNFPTALTALAALTTLVMWLVVIPNVLMVMSALYAGAMGIEGVRERIGLLETPGISGRRWGFRALGALSLVVTYLMAFGLPAEHPSVQRAARIIATNILVFTEYSYDQTCSVSSEQRLVAQLKYRKEMKASIISTAEDHGMAWPGLWWIFPLLFFHDYTFSRGTCDDQHNPR